jgi:hypothetical protein
VDNDLFGSLVHRQQPHEIFEQRLLDIRLRVLHTIEQCADLSMLVNQQLNDIASAIHADIPSVAWCNSFAAGKVADIVADQLRKFVFARSVNG